ncbi:MAG: SpoIIE family protein phosphatase [Crocinitomicaceae bacterium]|nr:SpoIIE family protein phosphatase [Crocinitomicaceae bacterium]
MKNLTTFDLTPQKPDVRIETIKLNGNFIDYNHLDNVDYDSLLPGLSNFREDISLPVAFENIPTRLVLPSDINHLTFIFSTHGWYTDKTQFAYRLVGLDETWSNPSEENWAEYRNLSYGKYTFEVKTIGESNTESDILKYEFEILPPWYHTWWARLIMLLILLVVFRFIIQTRTKQLLKKQALLEQKVKERTAELDEKNQELQLQNTIIEEQRIEAEMRKEKIEKQHILLEETHKEIRDSINYAKRIQEAILPPKSTIDKLLPDNFILYKPKDVVAGDFYWIHEVDKMIFFASADCTGHGVPGAMVSVVCYNALNRAVREFSLSSPEKILDKTREIVLETFQQNSSQVNDGMDISLIAIKRSETNTTLHYAGANNAVCIVRGGKLIELEPDKQPVGNYNDAKPVSLKKLDLQKAEVIYLFTDGSIERDAAFRVNA